MLSASTQVAGLAAGLSSPGVSVVGMMLWDANWDGTAFALNLYKCTLASFMFLATVLALPAELASVTARLDWTTALALALSSTLGIIIGDNTWLASMKILGARRVITVGALKPFLAAAMAGTLLRERSSPLALLAMAISVSGVLIVSLERVAPDELGARVATPAAAGYALAVIDVVFDVLGSVLTKAYAGGLGPWSIGLLRFGFAAVAMWLGVAARAVLALAVSYLHRTTQAPAIRAAGMTELMPLVPEVETEAEPCETGEAWRSERTEDRSSTHPPSPSERALGSIASGPAVSERAICEIMPALSTRAWALVSCGVCLVTYLSVALGNVALFALPLSLCLTLGSLGPVYSIPLSYAIKREVVTGRSAIGSVLAALGVGAFCQLLSS